MNCELIPDLIYLSDFGGDFESYVAAAYDLYNATFAAKTFYWNGKKIAHKKHPEIKGMSATFWHITSSGDSEENKVPDLRRYETIAWPAFILNYCLYECKELLMWRNRRKGKARVLFWCRDIDYVVILEEREDFYIFWTAYPVKYDHTRRQFLREWQQYQSPKQPI